MGLLDKLKNSDAAKKAMEQAKNPENKAKAKGLIDKMTNKKNPPEQPPPIR